MTMTQPQEATQPQESDFAARPPQADRRAYRRVRVPLKAKLKLADGAEIGARIVTVSVVEVRLTTLAKARIGQQATIWIDHIGRLEGIVCRAGEGEVNIRLTGSRTRRARTADALIEIVNHKSRDQKPRRATRITQDEPCEARLEDGTAYPCRILDMSVTGASLGVSPRPAIGTVLTIGKMRARVMRHHDDGVGIEFIKS